MDIYCEVCKRQYQHSTYLTHAHTSAPEGLAGITDYFKDVIDSYFKDPKKEVRDTQK